uniref:Uncharacterized protein n=1 Tax=Anguilla anguilla TaxID=7936 RepID=A0A0E9VKM1_ANGAN
METIEVFQQKQIKLTICNDKQIPCDQHKGQFNLSKQRPALVFDEQAPGSAFLFPFAVMTL